MRLEGTVATANWRRTLLGNMKASVAMFAKLNFSQPKNEKVLRNERDFLLIEKGRKFRNRNVKNRALNVRQRDFIRESKDKIRNEPLTPRGKVDSEITEAGVSPSIIHNVISNKLLSANVITEEIKITSKNSNNEDKQAIKNVISGSITKKYRQMKTLSEMTMTNHRKLAKVKAKSIKPMQH